LLGNSLGTGVSLGVGVLLGLAPKVSDDVGVRFADGVCVRDGYVVGVAEGVVVADTDARAKDLVTLRPRQPPGELPQRTKTLHGDAGQRAPDTSKSEV